jgi:gliding motility-associated-like protein
MKSNLLLLTFLFCIANAQAQPCTTLGQTPSTAFPVCGITTFTQSSVPSCGGTPIPTPCGAGGYTDIRPFWYRFTCFTSGTLAFIISPMSPVDDYDWVLFDITGRNPNDIYTILSLNVADNWSANPGNTGASNNTNGLSNCAGGTPNFSSMPTIIAGREYLLMVSNWSPSQIGYNLTFGGGTAAITNPLLPLIQSASANCDGTQVVVRFNKKIRCNSIAGNGSDFTITGGTTISATGYGCTTSFDTDSALVLLSGPLAPGNYNVAMASGSDGNTVLDNCGTGIVAGNAAPFTINAQPPLPMGTVTPPACAPVTITLTFTEPVLCNSVAANGSDFLITGPSAVAVSSATAVNCVNGLANTITLQLNAAIITGGIYQVAVATGTDGNTLRGQCNREVLVNANTTFTLATQPPMIMPGITLGSCTPSVLNLIFPQPVNCNSIAANGSDFLIIGPGAVTIVSATATNCNASGETTTVTLQLAAPMLAPGTYDLIAATGSDGNTISGNCGRQVAPGDATQFNLPVQPPVPMATVTPPPCVPTSITLTFSELVNCSSIAANGSDFIVTGPSAVTITSATPVNCNAAGETTTITLQFSSPILIAGGYQVAAAIGTDGNTITAGVCNRQVVAGNTAPFTLAAQPPLPIGTITSTSCAPTSIIIDFNESLDCSSISPDGSEFTITGPSGVVITNVSGQCNIVPNVAKIFIQFAGPITVGGTYQVRVGTGTDGNTIRGDCNRYITAGDFTTFTVPVVAPVIMDSIVPVACSTSSLRLILDAPILCASVAADGSDFIVTGPSPVTIASASSCNAVGLTTQIDIQLASPIVTGGNYTIQLVNGSDGDTFLSECYRPAPFATLNFIAGDTVSAVFQHQIQYDCETDIVNFSHDGQHNVNQWTWTVNGVAVGTSQTLTQSFSAASQNQVQLVVSNGLCSDTYSETIVLDNKVVAAFSGPDMVCPEDTARFNNHSTGQIDNWQWSFGNGNTSTLESPPAQHYPTTGTETLYTVSLTVSNNNGCQTSATKTVKVFGSCIIAVPTAFTPDNDGLNDHLYPLNALKAENLDFKVFNRWGQLLFHSRDWTKKWDGRVNGIPQATSVYVWTLNYVHRDTKVRYSLKGTSTLIR